MRRVASASPEMARRRGRGSLQGWRTAGGEDACRLAAARVAGARLGCQRQTGPVAPSRLVGQRRQAEVDAFARVAVALAVERLVRPVLLEQDRRQQVGARPARLSDILCKRFWWVLYLVGEDLR